MSKSGGSGPQLEVARIQSEINRLFDSLLRLREAQVGTTPGGWSPSVDVAESAEALLVEVELPGVDPQSLEIFAQEGNIVVRGERARPGGRREGRVEVLHDEREFGRFERMVPISAVVNPHKAEARLRQGVLSVRLPRVPNRRGDAVPIALQESTTEQT
jgi:HSP20 family protein